MSSAIKKIGLILVLLGSAPPGRGEPGLPATTTGEVKNFTLPERNKDGVLIWQLNGKHARFRPDNKMEIEDLVLSTFRKTVVDWTLSTPACVLNRETREAITESPVRIVDNHQENQRTEIIGTGFHWLSGESRFIIRSKAQVILHGGLSKTSVMEGGASTPAPAPASSAKKPPTTIDSDTLDFDYEKRAAVFEGNVIAVDPQLTVHCKKMDVLFSHENGEVVRVDGMGDVHLLHEGREGVSEKAVFTRQTGIVVLTEGTPQLKDEKGNWIRGASILYDMQARTLKVEKPHLEFLPSGGGNMLDSSHSSPQHSENLEAPGRGSAAPAVSAEPSDPRHAAGFGGARALTKEGGTGSLVLCAGGDVNLFTPKQASKIDANFLTHDLGKHVGTWEGNVHVVDPQLELKSKKMVVYFSDKGNEVIRVECYGEVHIYQQGKEAVSEKAVYTRESGILVLTEGNPKMKDEKGNWVKGKRIVYNTQTKIMHVEGSTMEFKPSSGGK